MPRLTLSAAGALGLLVLAGCAGPIKSKVPAGLAYDCGGDLGEAYIQFGGGGYLPGERALAKDDLWNPKEEARPHLRSTAKLWLHKKEYDLIAEWTEVGLRYRSEAPFKDGEFLVWSVGLNKDADVHEWEEAKGGPLGSEDARLGLRATADPEDEETAGGRFYATCGRVGRATQDSSAGPGEEHNADHSEPKAEHDEPHAP